MPPILRLASGIVAVVSFGMSLWLAPAPEPAWRRLVSLGLAALAISLLTL